MSGLLPLLLGHDSGSTSFPTMRVEVAFDYPPGAEDPIFTDVTDYVVSFAVRRGKSRELDKNQAGSCSIVLDNRDRRFDPSYTAGPYYTLVVPMKRVRVRMTWDTMYPVFDGFADSWDQQYENPNNATCALSITDAFKPLAGALLTAPYELEVLEDSPYIYWRMNESSSTTTATDYSGNRRDGTYAGSPTFGRSDAITDAVDGAVSFDGVDDRIYYTNATASASGPMSMEIWVKTTDVAIGGLRLLTYGSDVSTSGFLINLDNTNKVNVNVAGGGTVSVTGTTTVNDGNWHHIVATWTGSLLTLYVDGASEGTPASGSATLETTAPINVAYSNGSGTSAGDLFFIGTLDEIAIYQTTLSATRVAAHYAASNAWTGDTPGARIGRVLNFVDWPASLRNLDTGSSVLQSASVNGVSALAHAELVASSEFGQLFITTDGKVRLVGRTSNVNQTSQATFGDSGSELRYTDIQFDYSDELIRNDVRISRTNGVLQRSENTTSIGSYLRHTYQSDGLAHNSDTVSKNAADYLLAQYKDPLLRVTSITIAPQRDPSNLWPQVLGREIGEWVTIVRRPQGVGTAISQVCRIEGISHSYDARNSLHWQTTWQLSPAQTTAYWNLGTSGFGELGTTTRLFF